MNRVRFFALIAFSMALALFEGVDSSRLAWGVETPCVDLLSHSLKKQLRTEFRNRLCGSGADSCLNGRDIDIEFVDGRGNALPESLVSFIEHHAAKVVIVPTGPDLSREQQMWNSYGELTLQTRGDVMAFDIELGRAIRGKGLYVAGMQVVAHAFPQIRYLPSRMPVTGSDNAKIFIETAFGRASEFHAYREYGRFESHSAKERSEIFQRLVDAYRKMPSSKARDRSGIGRLEYLEIDPFFEDQFVLSEVGRVSFVASRSAAPSDPKEILFRTMKDGREVWVGLDRDGGMRIVGDQPPRALEVYDEMRKRPPAK